jgi:ABC-2 type transport system permease protein
MRFLRFYFATFAAVAADRSAVMVLILSIALYSFFYPAAYSHQAASHIPLAVADLDNTVLSRDLVRAAAAMRGVDIVARPGSLEEGKHLIESGDAEALLWIAPGFERDALRGGKGEIALFGNGAYLVRTRTALTALSGAIADTAREAIRLMLPAQGLPAPAPVRLVVRPLFNTAEGYGSALVPGVLALIVQQTLVLGIGLVLARWRGLGRRPARPADVFAAALAFATIGVCGFLYFFGFTLWMQDYPRGGNLAGLILFAPLFVLAVVAMGLFIGSFYHRREQSGQFLLNTSLPFFFLSGISWPQTTVSPVLIWFSRAFPTTPGMQAVVKLTQAGASLSDIAPELVNLAVLAVLYGSAAGILLCRADRTRMRG